MGHGSDRGPSSVAAIISSGSWAPLWVSFPSWIHAALWRLDDWIAAHPHEPFPLPIRVRQGRVARTLMYYLELRGVELCDGEIPDDVRAWPGAQGAEA